MAMRTGAVTGLPGSTTGARRLSPVSMFAINAGAIAGVPRGEAADAFRDRGGAAGQHALWMVLINWLRPGGSPPSGLVVAAGIAIGFVGIVMLSAPEQGACRR
ncbi:MAG: hypothetical protein IPK19_13060 [Chloroflexi bacterium]|nr:hypothetical protein [Chloroflexota bacterium]